MVQLAKKAQLVDVWQEYGKIKAFEDMSFVVEADSGLYRAKQAVSCLVRPEIEDRVLVAWNSVGECYILAILERAGSEKTSLSFQGDVDLRVMEGRLRVVAQDGVDLASSKDISLNSSSLKVYSSEGEMTIERLIFLGSLFHGQVEKIKLIANSFDSVVERLSQRIKRAYRFVEELDQLKAGSLNYLVKKALSLRGKYSLFTAEEDVKIDGERIHMG